MNTALAVVCRHAEQLRQERDAAFEAYMETALLLSAAKRVLHDKIVALGAAHKAADRQREQIAQLMGAPREDETQVEDIDDVVR